MTHTERERDILVELGAVRDRERVAFKCGGGGGGGDRFIKSGRRRSEEVGGDSQRERERRRKEGRAETEEKRGKKLMDQERSRNELLVASDARRNGDQVHTIPCSSAALNCNTSHGQTPLAGAFSWAVGETPSPRHTIIWCSFGTSPARPRRATLSRVQSIQSIFRSVGRGSDSDSQSVCPQSSARRPRSDPSSCRAASRVCFSTSRSKRRS